MAPSHTYAPEYRALSALCMQGMMLECSKRCWRGAMKGAKMVDSRPQADEATLWNQTRNATVLLVALEGLRRKWPGELVRQPKNQENSSFDE